MIRLHETLEQERYRMNELGQVLMAKFNPLYEYEELLELIQKNVR